MSAVGFYTDEDGKVRPITAPSGKRIRLEPQTRTVEVAEPDFSVLEDLAEFVSEEKKKREEEERRVEEERRKRREEERKKYSDPEYVKKVLKEATPDWADGLIFEEKVSWGEEDADTFYEVRPVKKGRYGYYFKKTWREANVPSELLKQIKGTTVFIGGEFKDAALKPSGEYVNVEVRR